MYDTLNEYTEGVVVEDYNSLIEVWKKLYDKTAYKIVYQPINPIEDFGDICDLVFECGDITFVVEEIDTFLSLNPAGLDRSFLNIVQRGRHRNINLVGITQRPYTMPAILRSQCKELYTFKQFEQRDIEWLRGILGVRADEVKDLQQFEFIAYINGSIDKGKTRLLSKTVQDVPLPNKENILPEGDKSKLQKDPLQQIPKEGE